MGVLREIIAHFAVQVDDAPLTKLDRQIQKLRDDVGRFASYSAVGFAAAAAATYGVVEAASRAEENMNVLQQTFKGSTGAVIEWSRTTSAAVGRSQYSLQEYAGRLGAFLAPKFPVKETAEYSKQLTQLAVDLGSFYNVSDEEAIGRVLSGLAGETEAVRRFGVDLSDTALQEVYAKQEGASKRAYRALTIEEKTRLRIQKLMTDTVDKQGDAARTADSWANSTKRMRDKAHDYAVELGKQIMPHAKKLLGYVERTVDWAGKLLNTTSSLQTALALAAGAAASLGAAKFLLLENLGQALKVAGLLGLAFLALEDVITFQRGGKSAFGDLITFFTGAKDPLRAWHAGFDLMLAQIRDVLELMGRMLDNTLMSAKEYKEKYGDKPFEYGRHAREMRGIYAQKALSEMQAQTQAVQSGNLASYIENRPMTMSAEEARAKFFKSREQYASSTGNITAADAAHGNDALYREQLKAQGKLPGLPSEFRTLPPPLPAAPVPHALRRPADGGGGQKVEIRVDQTFNGEASPEAVSKAAREGVSAAASDLDKQLRNARAATTGRAEAP